MGYILSKYNDTRLEGNCIGVESKRESVRFSLMMCDSPNNNIELIDENVADLKIAIAVWESYKDDDTEFAPTDEQEARWKEAARIDAVVSDLKQSSHSVEDMRKALNILQAQCKESEGWSIEAFQESERSVVE